MSSLPFDLLPLLGPLPQLARATPGLYERLRAVPAPWVGAPRTAPEALWEQCPELERFVPRARGRAEGWLSLTGEHMLHKTDEYEWMITPTQGGAAWGPWRLPVGFLMTRLGNGGFFITGDGLRVVWTPDRGTVTVPPHVTKLEVLGDGSWVTMNEQGLSGHPEVGSKATLMARGMMLLCHDSEHDCFRLWGEGVERVIDMGPADVELGRCTETHVAMQYHSGLISVMDLRTGRETQVLDKARGFCLTDAGDLVTGTASGLFIHSQKRRVATLHPRQLVAHKGRLWWFESDRVLSLLLA